MTLADFLLARLTEEPLRHWAEPVSRALHTLPESTLRGVAVVYAGHPDYREEWRP